MKEFNHEYAQFLYHTPTEFERSGGLYPVRAGINVAKPNYQVGPKVIECYSIHWVMDGHIELTYGSRTVHLRKGDIFCLYPGIRYRYQLDRQHGWEEEAPLRLTWLAFDGAHAEEVTRRSGFARKQPYVTGRATVEQEKLLRRIRQAIGSNGEESDLTLQSLMYRLFGELSACSPGAGAPRRGEDWLERCIRYMNTHFMEGITVSDVVEVAGVHRSHVYNAFMRTLGMSPLQYLIRLRMEKGMELLRQRSLSVTDISLSLGYPDLFSFSRAFCRYSGISPTQYQAQSSAEPVKPPAGLTAWYADTNSSR